MKDLEKAIELTELRIKDCEDFDIKCDYEKMILQILLDHKKVLSK